jgi:hypothetical protein
MEAARNACGTQTVAPRDHKEDLMDTTAVTAQSTAYEISGEARSGSADPRLSDAWGFPSEADVMLDALSLAT